MEDVAIDDLPGRLLSACGDRQMIVGLAGPPGVGKSTIAAWLADRTGGIVVPMDGFHLDHSVLEARGDVERKGAPITFDSWGFVRSLERLRRRDDGETVYFPRFDRTIENAVAGSIAVGDDALVIVEGNYLLLDGDPWHRTRAVFDLVVHLDLSERLRLLRLMRRHVRHGKSRPAAADFVRTSDNANARLVAASRHRADVAVSLDGIDRNVLR